MLRSYRTDGEFGDIVYQMPVMRYFGRGRVFIGTGAEQVSRPFTPDVFAPIVPLLESQPYVERVVEWRGEPIDYDLNEFRRPFFEGLTSSDRRVRAETASTSLVDWIGRIHQVPPNDLVKPWITLSNPRPIAPVVINRTPRYHNRRFPWKRVVTTYRDAIWIGREEEHATFCAEFRHVPYVHTENFLEAARIIAGARLFIGNQSACYAIAEAMKKPAVLEVFPLIPNCLFFRPDCVHGWDDTVDLPDPGSL